MRPVRLRHCAAITLSEQSTASACLAVQSGSNEAGMINPRGLSPVPAPLLRSIILATGVVGSLPLGLRELRTLARRNARTSALPLFPRTGARRGTAAKLDAQ